MTCLLQQLILICIAVAAVGISTTEGNSYCYNFNDNANLWTGTGYYWLWTGATPPPTPPYQPSPNIDSEYVWLDSLLTVGSSSTISGPNITLYYGDVVRAVIYRDNIVDAAKNNPIVSFREIEGPVPRSIPILWSYKTTLWDLVSITCDSSSPCCENYPCYGYFELTGLMENSGEIMAVDSISVNDVTCY